MSMISELLKTPAEARQEDIIKLRQVGNQTSGNLRAAPQGQYSGLPGIFNNYAAGIADQQATASDGLFRGITQAGGQLARAAGGAGLMDQQKAGQLQQTLQNASLSPNERDAMQNQEIMSGVRGATDPIAAYSEASKKAFAAGKQKLGMALEQKVGELQTAQEAAEAAKVEAARKQQETTIKGNTLKVKQEELKMEQGQLSNQLGIDVSSATIESMGEAQILILGNLDANGNSTEEGKQLARRALKTQDKRNLIKINNSEFTDTIGDALAKKYVESMGTAASNNAIIRVAQESTKLLTGKGILSGTGSSIVLPTMEALQQLGFTSPEANEKLMRTRQYLQAQKTAAKKYLASGVFGGANSLSDRDSANADELNAVNINIPRDSLERIIDYNTRAAIFEIKEHNKLVRDLNKRYADSGKPPLEEEVYIGQKKSFPDGSVYKYEGGDTWSPVIKEEL
tara:strand:+ start:413 stop:1777 length:1365 start_codon:yes stop_codon:yes gene_type:complete